jgi:AcrR family transcriptional regulator
VSPPARGRAESLTPATVVEAGLELLDEVGLTAFSMRAVADRLGTYPATLYWHVGNRAALLAAILDRVLSEMDVPDPHAESWTTWLRKLAREYRRVIHRHPHAGTLVSSELQRGSVATQLVELILGVLAGAGFRGRRLAAAYNVLVGSVTGWVAIELSRPPADGGATWAPEFEEEVARLDPATFPTIAAYRSSVSGKVIGLRWSGGAEVPLDHSFATALDVWINGLEALLD